MTLKKTKVLYVLIAMALLFSLASCGEKKEQTDLKIDKTIENEAKKMVKERIVPIFEQIGVEVSEYQVKDVTLAGNVPYSQGGEFNFYEVAFCVKPQDSAKVETVEEKEKIKLPKDAGGWIVGYPSIGKLFLSAYDDGKTFYEFLWLRESDFAKSEEGDLDFKNFVDFRYESIGDNSISMEEEYTLNLDGAAVSLGQNFKGEAPLEGAELVQEEAGNPISSYARYLKTYTRGDIRIETFSYFEKHFEIVSSMFVSSDTVETARGIKVGDSKEDLLLAYGGENLVFCSSFGGESFNRYGFTSGVLEDSDTWSILGFRQSEATSNNYMAFYIVEGKIKTIEMGNGFDYTPFGRGAVQYPFEVETFINDHIDEPERMKYDVTLPKVKDAVVGSENMNALIQMDFEQIFEYSQKGAYEPAPVSFAYPLVDINYRVSNLGDVAVLNIFTSYSSALGSGVDRKVNSYYYDTTCGARMSMEAAIYRLGYTKEGIEAYFKHQFPDLLTERDEQWSKFRNLVFYFNETGEPEFIINGFG